MSDTIYELSNFDYMYDYSFYYQFKNDDTVVGRIKGFLREQLRHDSDYFEDDVKDNMRVLHLLKGVHNIEDIANLLERTNWSLEEKGLL